MSSSYGKLFTVTTFGESHGAVLGAVVDGVPSGIELAERDINAALARRRPGQSKLTSARKEADQCEILSGVHEGMTTGTPIAVIVRNTDARSGDYRTLADLYRPGHADFTYAMKYGIRDTRGGGRSSGRETIGRVIGGAIAVKLLQEMGVQVQAYTVQVGKVKAKKFCASEIEKNPVRCADAAAAKKMIEVIEEAVRHKDSVGAVVECRVTGVPAGWGEPVFDKLDAELAKAVCSLGGVKGIEFGEGFAAATLFGSENNDAMSAENGFETNHAGGVLGGISNGEPILFRAAVKPTPSIAQEQHTVDVNGADTACVIRGRHDPCLAPRIVPAIEAMTAIVLADMMLQARARA